MREIKFRAWWSACTRMVKVIFIDFEKQDSDIEYIGDATEYPIARRSKLSELVLMQFTGLKDKNGKEIYEGDVVKDRDAKIAYVTFLLQEMGFVLVYEKYDTRLGHRNTRSEYNQDLNLKVVGNIYENSELLEAEK